MPIPRFPRMPLAAAGLLAGLTACGTPDATLPPADPGPQRIEPLEELPQLKDDLRPPSEEEWVVIYDPTKVAPQSLADAKGIELVGVEYHSDGTELALFYDDNNDNVTKDDFTGNGFVASLVNEPLESVANRASLVIVFIDGNWARISDPQTNGLGALQLDEAHNTLGMGRGIKIGVVDTGAQLDHDFLSGRTEELLDHRLSSWEEDRDFLDNDGDGIVDAGYGHGTMVASHALMVAPEATIFPVRALNHEGWGTVLGVLSAVWACADAGCDIINLSLTFDSQRDEFDAVLELLTSQGIVFTCAGGNDGLRNPGYPATSPHTIGVGAVNVSDEWAVFSGAGRGIDLAAPGVSVHGAWITGGRAESSGTSMAAPCVAGAIALVAAHFESSAGSAVDRICQKADPILPSVLVTHGRIAPANIGQ